MRLKYIGTNFKSYATFCGSLRFNRAILRPETDEDLKRFEELVGEGRTTYYPMDSLLGVENIPFLMSCEMLASVVSELIRDGGKNEDIVTRKYKDARRVSQRERFIACAGEAAYRNQIKEVKTAMLSAKGAGKTKRVERSGGTDESPGILYIFMGSAMRYAYRDGETSGRPERLVCRYAAVFRERDIELLFGASGEVRGYRVNRRDVVCAQENEDLKWLIKAQADRNGFDQGMRVAVLSDGSGWINEVVEEIFPCAEVILDRERLKKYTENFFRYCVSSSERAEELIDRAEERLNAGDTDGILEDIRPYRFTPLPENIPDIYSLIYENRGGMNYSELRKRGLWPGTGIRDCSEQRLADIPERISGGVTSKKSLRGILALLSLRESGRLDELAAMVEVEEFDKV